MLSEKTKFLTDNKNEYQIEIVWRNVVIMLMLHIAALYGIKLAITDAKYLTLFFTLFLLLGSGFGILVKIQIFKFLTIIIIILTIFHESKMFILYLVWCT